METITVQTRDRCQMLDVTDRVRKAAQKSGIKQGFAVCFVPHTTAAVTIQENADPDVLHDVLWKLEQLIPERETAYQHREGNSDAHLKCSFVGASELIPVADGRLVLGTWQGIYFCEFDGPRSRRLQIQCVGG
jgi:secondary thiamine-phosphate synthase enzyme